MIHLAPGPTLPGARGSVWLPIIATPQTDPVGVFYDLLLHDARQQRPRLEVCKVLAAGAQRRAFDLAHGAPWAHHDSAGVGANGLARAFGCRLPSEYSDGQNYIESLCGGSADATVMFNSLANSQSHKVHLFGENDFFRKQYHAGIAMAKNPDSQFGFYWVIWIAICE